MRESPGYVNYDEQYYVHGITFERLFTFPVSILQRSKRIFKL